MFRSLRVVLPALIVIRVAAVLDGFDESFASSRIRCVKRKVQLWQTLSNKSKLFEKLPDVVTLDCNSSAAAHWTMPHYTAIEPHVYLTLRPSQVRQTIVGYGGALTASSAHVLRKAPKAVREGALQKLFGKLEEKGANLNFIRIVIGASDFSLPAGTLKPSYDEVPGDKHLKFFSVVKSPHDIDVLPMLQDIYSRNPNLTVLASPWTAPLWMKTDHTNGRGVLQEESYQVYAEYLAKYLSDYRSRGINITYLTLQNEPGHGYCGKQRPCMPMTASQQSELGLWFESARVNRGLDTKLLAYDHNWEMSWYQWFSAVGFYALKYIPVWLLYGMMGLTCGIVVDRKTFNRFAEGSGKALQHSLLCRRAADCECHFASRIREWARLRRAPKQLDGANIDPQRRKPGAGSILKASKVKRCGSAPLLSDEHPAYLTSDLSLGLPFVPSQNKRLDKMLFTASQARECASQGANSALAFLGSKDPCARKLRYLIYILTSVLLSGRIVGLLTKVYAHRYGYFVPGMGSQYPQRVVSSPGADLAFHGVAWHCYGGKPSAMGKMYSKYPALEQHVTECSGFTSGNDWGDDVIRDSEWIIDSLARHGAKSILRFNFALDENNGPSCGETCCTTCSGMLTLPRHAKTIDNITVGPDWYSLAHHSAFVQKGAQVVKSDLKFLSGYDDSADAVAYRNPSGHLIVVVLNKVRSKETLTVRMWDTSTNQSFDFQAPHGLTTLEFANAD